jgi:hypothetical protein
MTGRTRLSWVTALTILSLLLGGGALNAFADGQHGNKGHGGGSGKVEHQQQQKSAEVKHDVQSSNQGQSRADDDRRGRGHDDEEIRGRGRDNDDDEDDDDEDLVTPPARVTDDVRPGKGCGDKNHEHLRHDECPDKFLDDNDEDAEQMEVESEED